MPPDDEDRQGFYRGFVHSPVAVTVACTLLIAGVTLAFWTPLGPSWRWLSGVVLTAIAFICLWRLNLRPQRAPSTELELCRRRRSRTLASAISFVVYAALAALLAVKFGRRGLDTIVYPGGFAVGFLVVGGFKLSRYRHAGRELRRLQSRCEQCGYDLRGLPEPRCPECGTPFTPGAGAPSRILAQPGSGWGTERTSADSDSVRPPP